MQVSMHSVKDNTLCFLVHFNGNALCINNYLYEKYKSALLFPNHVYIFDHLDLFRCKLKLFINDFKYLALNVDRFDLLLHV